MLSESQRILVVSSLLFIRSRVSGGDARQQYQYLTSTRYDDDDD